VGGTSFKGLKVVALTVGGNVYLYPERKDKNWGQRATAWAVAISANTAHIFSPTAPLASVGQVRLGNTNSLAWRNAGNTNNIRLYVDALNRLIYDDGVTQKDLSLTGGGNVQNANPATDNALVRFDGPSGAVVQNSNAILNDGGDLSLALSVTAPTVTASTLLQIGAVDVAKALPPIGTIIAHYDFNGALVPDASYWKPCDGQNQLIGGVSRTTPDLSGRYIVGFGTDGGGDNDTAAWDTAAVGNAGHTVNLEHGHLVSSHTHSISSDGSHSHNVNSHTHDQGDMVARVALNDSGTNRVDTDETATPSWTSNNTVAINGTVASGHSISVGSKVFGNTGGTSPGTNTGGVHSHGGATGAASPTTTQNLSTAQSIQPRSIRVRYYIRGT
jgi:hypothetical protein